MKIFSSIILVLAATMFQKTQAQSNYLNGYVLTAEKDTLFGKIDNKSYYDNSKFCDFKSPDTESITRFYPENTFGYRFNNGKYYVSNNVELDGKQVRLFTEFLINGKLDIFFVQDNKNSNHYFASKDSLPLKELKYSEKMVADDGVQKLRESKPYIGLLTYYTGDCPSIKEEIQKLNEPDHKKLIHFAEKYHKITCKDEECIIYEKKIPRKIKLNFSGGPAYYFSSKYYDIEPSLVPNFGFNIQFQQAQWSERVYLGIGLNSFRGSEGFFMNGYMIPVSISYHNPKMGLSPLLTYEFDLNTGFISQGLNLGLNYQLKNISFFIMADLKTIAFIKPYASSVKLGINFDLIK